MSFGGRAPRPRMDHGRPIGSRTPREVRRGEEARCEGRLGVRPNSDVSVNLINLFTIEFLFKILGNNKLNKLPKS